MGGRVGTGRATALLSLKVGQEWSSRAGVPNH
jgi:hypothetical protein